VILGACSPQLAHRELGTFEVVRKSGLESLVAEADQKLRRALERI
jgi:hypothetical protein